MAGPYRLLIEQDVVGHPAVGPACNTRDEALAPIVNYLMRGWPDVPNYRVLVDLDALIGEDAVHLNEALQTDASLRAIYEMGRMSG